MDLSSIRPESILENLPEAVFLEDLEGHILDANDRACELLDYKKKELLELTVNDLVPEGAPAFLPDEIDTATASGEPLETVNLDREGNEIPVELRGNIIEVDERKRILVTVRDISNRKRAEAELQQNERLFQSTLEAIQDGISVLNTDLRIKFVNSTMKEWYGENLPLKGKKCYEAYNNREKPCEPCPTLKCMKTRQTERKVVQGLPGSEAKWVELFSYPMSDPETGELEGVVEFVQDITGRKRSERALQDERDKLMHLHGAVDRLQHQNTEEGLAQTAVNVAEKMLDFELCAISIVEGDYLVPKANSSGLAPEETARFKVGEGLTGKTVQKGETIWGDDVRNHPEAKPTSGSFRAFISTPIGTLGNFQVISTEVASFDERDVELVEILAGHLREEFKRVQLEEELRKKANSIKSTKEKLESLHGVARKLESADKEEDIYQLGVEAAVETLDFLVCSFAVAKEGKFEVKATSREAPHEWTHEEMSVDEGLSGKTFRTGETYLCRDIREEEVGMPAREEYRSFISIPIGDIGVFQVISEEIGAFTEEDARLAELLVGHVYEALQRVKLEKDLKEQVIHDPLTGLYNRRYFTESLSNEIERAARYERPIAFLMLDINRFKEINDQYSHQTGDKILQKIADFLVANVRSADAVIRYGGDEFLIMMPATDGEVSQIIERLKGQLVNWNERNSLIDLPLTMAMGISHWSPEQNRGVEEALKEADRNMYKDKGR